MMAEMAAKETAPGGHPGAAAAPAGAANAAGTLHSTTAGNLENIPQQLKGARPISG